MELQKLVFALKTTCSGGQLHDNSLLLPDLQRCARHLVATGQAASAQEAVQRIGEHVAQVASPPSAPESLKLAAAHVGPLLPVVAQRVQGLLEAEKSLSEAMAGVSVPGWSVDRNDLWTLVMDQQVKSGPFVQSGHPFSYPESGYVESLLRGMAQVLTDVQRPIDVDGLKALHRAALQHRPGTAGLAGEFRDGVAVDFAPACGDWASEEHVQELKRAADYGGNNPFYSLEDIEGRGTVVHARALPCGAIESHVDEVLAQHHGAMSGCENAQEKMARIAQTCHELALTHPFVDGNGRVIGGLLVNRLLLEAGLPPYRPLSVGLVDLPPADLAEHICNACGAADAHPVPEHKTRVHFTEFLSDTKPQGAPSRDAAHAARFPTRSPG